MRKTILLFCSLAVITGSALAQELRCDVEVNVPELRTADPAIFENLETSITEFMNNRRWTNHTYKPNERIRCKLIVTIVEEKGGYNYEAKITIQSSRPVYNSDYRTVVFSYSDKSFSFEYAPFQPLDYTDNVFLSNLTSTLAYYAYIIIGYDFDTFEMMGGKPYFLKAKNIVNSAQNSAYEGWKSFSSTRNRYWLVESLLNNRYRSVRQMFYTYHMKGLDMMYKDRIAATSTITNEIEQLDEFSSNNPNNFLVQLFFNAKADELIDLYRSVPNVKKTRAINILAQIDAGNSDRYLKLIR